MGCMVRMIFGFLARRFRAIGLRGFLAVMAALLSALVVQQTQAQATGAAPVTCRVGVNVEDLYELDMARDTFGAVIWVWSVCPQPGLTPLETISFPTAAAGLNMGQIGTEDAGTEGYYAARRVQGTFRYNWNMRQYPFDHQLIVIPIDENRYGANRMVFEPDTTESFLTPDIRGRLTEWQVSDIVLTTAVSEEESTYGMPGAENARFARMDVSFSLERQQVLTFLKLTAGVYAGVFIALLSFFYDPNDKSAFGGKLGLLVGVLFAVLVNMRSADLVIGDTDQITLVTMIHLVTLGLIVVLAIVALRDRRHSEKGHVLRHPDYPTLAVVGSVYVLIVGGLILHAALT
ncbi:MAG: hypothetical protein DI533_03285 [Cereibacter sphaeroides]|uniref:Uncharacterized protein n=1 Tax=Cereibacter sphaeroides TaxID=1063 RepID=A0A2W5SK25_CERSP|nr:MAG: hypothetical protein DI533_03285 [Cereibacter sphaeroides]